MLIEALKQKLSLSAVAHDCFPKHTFSTDGYTACPFCGRAKKLRISEDKRYRCFHPECGVRGDVINFVIDAGKARNVSEALRLLKGQTQVELAEPPQPAVATLERIWAILRSLLPQNNVPLAFCEARCLPSDKLGFYPEGNFLRNYGFSDRELSALGLLTKSGDELLSNRLIFPFRDRHQRLTHLQGRYIGTEEDAIRWLSSLAKPSIDHFFLNAEAFVEYAGKPLFLCEGGTDTYSLAGFGLPAVGIAGVEVNLESHAPLFRRHSTIIAAFDNDRYALGTRNAGQYKSWLSMLPELVKLQQAVPDLLIICLVPPSRPGLVDLNDWIMKGLTKKELLKAVGDALPLRQFILNQLPRHATFLRPAIDLLDYSDENYAESLRGYLSTIDVLEIGRCLL